MRILVIDDTHTNLDAAKQTLAEHELTLAASYDEAYKLLEKPKGETQSPFDVVLCDLLMPAGREQQGDKGRQYVGQEMPVGIALALMAVLQGAKYVAVVTNLNHHEHPAAALLDRLGSDGLNDTDDFVKIRANGVPIGFVNYAPMIGVEGTSCAECGGTGKQTERDCWICKGSGKRTYDGSACGNCNGSGRETPGCYSCSDGKVPGKNWGKVVAALLAAKPA